MPHDGTGTLVFNGMLCSCRISTDKRVSKSLCHSRASCLANGVQRIKTHEHVKFYQNRSIGCEDIKIFQFFKMAGHAILDFQICDISFGDSVWKADTHHRAKCRQNWSTCCGIHCNFSNFQNGRRHLEFLK